MIDGNFNEYLHNLKCPNVFGTKTELLALGLHYERNIMVFEPFNGGQHLVNNPSFNDRIMVFSSPTNHFDIVQKEVDERANFNGNFGFENFVNAKELRSLKLNRKFGSNCVRHGKSVAQ